MGEGQVFEDGLEKYPASYVVGQNLIMLLVFGLGAYGMRHIQTAGLPLLSIIYLSTLILMLYVVLRGVICTHCAYFGKTCSMGWGRIAGCLFKQKEGDAPKIGYVLAFVVWIGGMLLPLTIMIITLVQAFSTRGAILLGAFVVLAMVSIVWHKKSCERCRNRFTCPASAAKKKPA